MDNFLESFKQIDRKYKLLFLLILLVCIILAILLTKTIQSPKYNINIYPNLSSDIDINISRFSIATNPNISQNQDFNSKIEFMPNVSFTTSFVSNQLIIKPQHILRDSTKYTLRIANLELEDHQIIGLKEFKFTAKELNREQISDQEKSSVSNLKDRFPVLQSLPIYDLEYQIAFSIANPDRPTIIITTLAPLNRPEQFTEYVERSKEIRKTAIDRLDKLQANWRNDYDLEFSPSDSDLE